MSNRSQLRTLRRCAYCNKRMTRLQSYRAQRCCSVACARAYRSIQLLVNA